MPSYNSVFKYRTPSPHVGPFIALKEDQQFTGALSSLNQFVPLIQVPRETAHYSSLVIEEIMFNINLEYEARGRTKPTWKKYRSSTSDFEAFVPTKSGLSVREIPLQFFSQVISDIQQAIESLISDTNYPDDKGSYFARIFGNKTTSHGAGFWTQKTFIKNGYIVPASNSTGKETINALDRIIGSTADWPFLASSNHVNKNQARIGVDFAGTQYIKSNENNGIETSAADFPASVIGKTRTEDGVTGIDGIDLPMRPEGRPGPFSRKNISNTSLGVGAGKEDLDAGYTFIGHHPLVIEQLRYQPPIIEHFGGGNTENFAQAHYTQNLTSNQTINIPFVLANPKERTFRMNWGKWLFKGFVGVENSLAKIQASSAQYDGFIITNCPFSLFFPPPTVTCSCGAASVAYAIWGSNLGTLIWEEIAISQTNDPASSPKMVGPKTRLRIKYSYTGSGGSPNANRYFSVMARLNSISDVNQQPFIPIFVAPNSSPHSTLSNIIAVQGLSTQSHSDGSVSVNIIDAIKKTYPTHSGAGDLIIALAIFVQEEVSGQATCNAEDGPDGRFVPASCSSSVTCSLGTGDSSVDYIELYEPPLESTSDIRLF